MARKQVLVQLDDELLQRLDRVAEEQGVSRSELLRRGARAVLNGMETIEADRRLRAAYGRQREEQDAWIHEAARLALEDMDEW